MNDIIFSYKDTCGVSLPELLELASSKNIDTHRSLLATLMNTKTVSGTEYASLEMPFEDSRREHVIEVVAQKKKLRPTMLVVVGIGGSSLGAKAVQQAVFGRLRVKNNVTMPTLYFAETVDTDRMSSILSLLEQELARGKNILINVVTKSGTTTETLANFYVILGLLKKYRPVDYAELVVVTTDKDSFLWHMAQRELFTYLEIPKRVGGRYSVFSSVGLFPLLMVGIAIEELCAGARSMVKHCLNEDIENNPAIMSALIQYYHYERGVTINDLFLFSVDLEAVGKWYRQLIAESIGKEFDRQGKQVLMGITPTISLGSIDLHSVAQLYLGGPRDKCTTFVTVEKNDCVVRVPQEAPGLAGHSFSEIMHALSEGTKEAYLKNNRPFCSVVLPKKNEFSIGQFLQFKMMETIYLGFLCNVDPFDQPNVELYKREAHKLLERR
jgi:glucose-6-phosphate isomerase